jgi:glycosyltransferase involved in cell wall biosynthesis
MNKSKISIIIPVYNEADAIGDLVLQIRSLYPDFEVIVINDGSSDDSAAVASNAGTFVYSHPYNIGNGAAIKSGIRIASGDILVFIDGDLQHDPKDSGKMLECFPDYDMVVGARSMGGQASLGRALGNKIYNWLASYVAKFKVHDLTSGFRAVKADVVKKFVYLLPNTYPSTLTLCVLRNGRSLKYIPIKASERKAGQSNVKPIKDGVRFFMIIIKICTLYSPFRVFLPVSFLTFFVGLLYYMYTFIKWHRFTNMSALLFATSIIIFMMGLISEQVCQMRFERSEG